MGKHRRVREVRIDSSSSPSSPIKPTHVPVPKEDCTTKDLRDYVLAKMSHFDVKLSELGRQGEADRSQMQRFNADMNHYVRKHDLKHHTEGLKADFETTTLGSLTVMNDRFKAYDVELKEYIKEGIETKLKQADDSFNILRGQLSALTITIDGFDIIAEDGEHRSLPGGKCRDHREVALWHRCFGTFGGNSCEDPGTTDGTLAIIIDIPDLEYDLIDDAAAVWAGAGLGDCSCGCGQWPQPGQRERGRGGGGGHSGARRLRRRGRGRARAGPAPSALRLSAHSQAILVTRMGRSEEDHRGAARAIRRPGRARSRVGRGRSHGCPA